MVLRHAWSLITGLMIVGGGAARVAAQSDADFSPRSSAAPVYPTDKDISAAPVPRTLVNRYSGGGLGNPPSPACAGGTCGPAGSCGYGGPRRAHCPESFWGLAEEFIPNPPPASM